MTLIWIRRKALVVLFVALALATAHARAEASKLDALLKHVAPQANVIAAVPSLKQLNDDITELLGGMDRQDMIAAGRPIDLAKSMLGLGGAIDDRRGAAVVLMITAEGAPVMYALLPVIDQDSFLESNFTHDESSGAYTTANGMEVFIRKLADNMMLLTDTQASLEAYDSGEGAASAVAQRFGADSQAFFDQGEVVLMMDQSGARYALTELGMAGGMFRAAYPVDGELERQLEARRDAMLNQIAGLAYVLDADPLGVTAHGLVKFLPESELATALKAQPIAGDSWMKGLPKKSYYLAAGFNLESAGALEALETVAPMLHVDLGPFHDVLRHAQRVSFICSPSPAGFSGGLLNDSALVVQTQDPEAAHAAMRAAMNAMTDKANATIAQMNAQRAGAAANDASQDSTSKPSAPALELAWTDGKAVGDTGLTADAWELRGSPTTDMMLMVAQTAVFGQSKRGFITTTNNAVVMTFSQRPAVLAAACSAVNGGESSLADDAVLRSVHRWMGEPAAAEMFIHLGQINKFATNAAKSFGPAGQMPMPQLDEKGPPVGLKFGIADAGLTSALALPAPVLAELLREMEGMFRPAARASEVQAEPVEPE